MSSASDRAPRIHVSGLTMAYGSYVIQHDLDFVIRRGEVFVIMGGSGSGKSTLLNHMVGLKEPARGDVVYDGESFWGASPGGRDGLRRRLGVSFQQGALWSSMTLAENVGLPLQTFTRLPARQIREIVVLKRAGVARAMALDPDILFFDEPSAGLDPISSRRLDDLILELRDSLGATMVVVTHELASIFAIGDNAVFLDAESRTMIACGPPKTLRDECPNPTVRTFLRRGESAPAAGGTTA